MSRPWTPPSREEILETLRSAAGPMTPDELATSLKVLDPAQREILDRRLAAMERDGQLMPNRKGVLLLASKLDFIAGRVIGHRDGFGFMRPDEGGPDLFLPSRQMGKVMHGDRVLVKRVGEDGRGRPEGAIVEVTERANRLLVGRFLNERGVALVVPEDNRIKHDILIPPGQTGGATHGQVVTCEIIDPPERHVQPIGRIHEVLGDLGDPGMEIEIAVRKFDVPHQFPPEALARSESLPAEVEPGDLGHRVDLRDVPLITIDGADARDFDDAVYCEPVFSAGKRPRQNGFRVLVAIADVSHYVRPGDPLDVEAINRSTSVYFPRRVIPMLPEKLSNGLCSLNPLVDRLVLVCDMVISNAGKVRAYQFYEAVMHSAARMTYDAVWGILSGRQANAGDSAETPRSIGRAALEERLVALHEVFKVLMKARNERGALEFDTVETKIVCDPAGRIEKIVAVQRNDAHRLIEECMLAANVCSADFVKRHKHAGLYRVHEGPTKEKLALLRTFLKTCGLSLDGGDDPQPADFATLGQKIQGRPDADLLQTMMLRSMQQAVYTPINAGHFGLAYPAYTHFTSPIRRYPDLLTHRVIKAILADKTYQPTLPDAGDRPLAPALHGKRQDKAARPPTDTSAPGGAALAVWVALGNQCSSNERRADEASRDVEAWLKSQYMRDRVGEEYHGRITGVAPFGVFVTLDSLHVEGMVHVSELGEEYFQYNDAGHELRGERTGKRFRLTDPIDVQVSRVDLEARRIEFRLAPRSAVVTPGVATGRGLPPAPSTRGAKPSGATRSAGKNADSGAGHASRKGKGKSKTATTTEAGVRHSRKAEPAARKASTAGNGPPKSTKSARRKRR